MDQATNIKPAMRILAVVVLVCWSVALAVCWHHCTTGACSKPSTAAKSPPCHAQHDEDKSSGSSSGQNGCFAKQLYASQLDLASVSAPTQHLAYEAAITVVPIEVATPANVVVPSRAKRLDCVFTPEVSLGPAFHSLAPPGLA